MCRKTWMMVLSQRNQHFCPILRHTLRIWNNRMEQPYGTYYTGQTVSGKCVINLDRSKNVKAIALKVCGYAKTHWSKNQKNRRGGRQRHRRAQYRGQQDYISSTTYLAGSEESISITINPGTHTYAFSCKIPEMCPSSFEGSFGYIRYVVKLVLIRPWKHDQTHTVGFTVLKLNDLNLYSEALKLPTNMEIIEHFWCTPCLSKPLCLSIDTPQGGYVPGQVIPINAKVNNSSSIPISEVEIALNLIAEYTSQEPRQLKQVEKINLAKKRIFEVGNNCQMTYSEGLRVPATPPTCLNLCSIIQLSYEIEVIAKMKCPHSNPIATIPITIGNVPLVINPQHTNQQRSPFHQEPQLDDFEKKINITEETQPTNNNSNSVATTSRTVQEAVVTAPVDQVTNIAGNYDCPPPSYEQAMNMTTTDIGDEDQDNLGTQQFAPRYPVYNIPESLIRETLNHPDPMAAGQSSQNETFNEKEVI